MMEGNRIVWIDWAKAFGIFLVVFGHIKVSILTEIIYYFHMPFFFILSGILYKDRPFKEELRRTTKYLIVPYLIYSTFLTIITPPPIQ